MAGGRTLSRTGIFKSVVNPDSFSSEQQAESACIYSMLITTNMQKMTSDFQEIR